MRMAIMQPYVFPYVGYFQLIEAVDTFVFYDDVNFIKSGWIHRNNILINDQPFLFSVPLQNQSSYSRINETKINYPFYYEWKSKFLKTLNQAYSKAPYFTEIYKLVIHTLDIDQVSIASLSMSSVMRVSAYLNIEVSFQVSSQLYSDSRSYSREKRLIDILRKNDSNQYINVIGGKELYSKSSFEKEGIELSFLESTLAPYRQKTETFTKGLSIIDVLMFNDIDEARELLKNYSLS